MKTTIRMKGILAAALMACLFPLWGIGGLHAQVTVIGSGYCGANGGTNLTWTLTSDSVLTISGSGAMERYVLYSYVPWYYNRSTIATITIGDSVTTIGDYAFFNCDNLTSIVIPDSVATIESYAFYRCDALTSVTIGGGIGHIRNDAFYNCSKLASLTIYAIHQPILGNKDVFYNVSDTIPVYVLCGRAPYYRSTWGWGYFKNYIDTIDVPVIYGTCGASGDNLTWQLSPCDGVLTINGSGDMANYNPSPPNSPWYTYPWQIQTLIIGDSVTSIGNYAFYHNGVSSTIIIGNKVSTIGDWAFRNSGVGSVTMGKNLTTIGVRAFNNCTNLSTIVSHAVKPPVLIPDVFGNVDTTIPVYVQCESVPAYKSDKGWSYFSNYIGVVEDSTFVCDTVCYGEAYSGYGFNISHAATGDYCRTVDCDSTICLNLFAYALPDKPVVTQNENTLISDSPTGNQWYLDNAPIPNATNQTHTYTKNGVYYVIVSNEHGCSAKSDTIKINDVGIVEVTKLQGYEVRSYEVYDMLGRRLAPFNSPEGGKCSPPSEGLGEALPTGIYVIKIYTDKGIITRKIVKY